jgi:beta-phosphoglucomutase
MVMLANTIQARAVIFDFDGVIVDTEPLHYQAFQRILEPLGLGFSWGEYEKTYMGFDDRDAFLEAFKTHGRQISHAELSTLIESKADIFQEVIRDGVKAYPGVLELIKSLHDSNVPLAICSGALRSDIDPILATLDLASCFELIVTADDVSKSKPDPECYLVAYNKLCARWPQSQIFANETVAIEDTPAGIAAASQAGLKVIAVTNSYPKEQLGGATLITDTLAILL